MLSKKVFWEWFKAEVETRWTKHHFEWLEIGDWRVTEGCGRSFQLRGVSVNEPFRSKMLRPLWSMRAMLQMFRI